MTTSARNLRATSVDVRGDMLVVGLEDGRTVSVPLSWFPRLEAASEEQLRDWKLIGPGWGIHWPEIDEHVSIVSLLRPEDTIPSREIREHEAARDC